MRVPLLDLKQQLAPLRDDILLEITELLDSTGYIMGPKVEALEEEIASYCGANYGIGVSSGTDALLAVLMALDVGRGDYVITTPYTFIATLGCILRLGAKPLFVDIDPKSFNIDPDFLAETLESGAVPLEKIKALIPVHLYGQCADMERIMDLARRYGLPVVEDAAQAIGAACPLGSGDQLAWHKAGSMGTAGCFSFFPSKNLGAIGDGGMITVNDPELAEKIRIIRGHGGSPKYHHGVLGGNFRLDPIQAVALRIKLPHLPDWHQARRSNADLYDQLFKASGLVDDGSLGLPARIYQAAALDSGQNPDYHIFNQYVLRCKDRDQLRDHLLKEMVGVEIYYPIPLHKQELMGPEYHDLALPQAEKAALQTLALPIYPELTDEMQHYVVEKIIEFFR